MVANVCRQPFSTQTFLATDQPLHIPNQTAGLPRAAWSGKGFTLVELLVVITIIGILMSLLLPAVQQIRAAARRMQCANNLKQISLALLNYEAAIKTFPHGTNWCCSNSGGNWATMIFPYVEQQALYDQLNFEGNFRDDEHAEIVRIPVSVFVCPADGDASNPVMQRFHHNATPAHVLWYPASMGPTHMDQCPFCPDPTPSPENYCCQGWNFGTNGNGSLGIARGTHAGIFGRNTKSTKMAAIKDGSSNTLLVGETLPEQCTFIGLYSHNFPLSGTSIPLNLMESADGTEWYRTCGFKSAHTSGANFAMADGSVHFLTDGVDYQLYNALGTRSGREVAVLP